MKTVGIICEYNPFHSGHAYQLACIREQHPEGATIVCLMSGHATQRGELAIADKFTRAEMALRSGADLVLELPYPYCAASASYFAGAGVAILDALGIEKLSFGSECAELPLLERTAAVTESPAFHEYVAARQRRGEGSAQAYFNTLAEMTDADDTRFLANDILALEYVRAIRRLESSMYPVPILRKGNAYRDPCLQTDQYPSATALRACLETGDINRALLFVPESAQEMLCNALETSLAPTCMSRLDTAILTYLRNCPPETIADAAEMQGGLANRLCAAARTAVNFEDLLTAASSKSYPTARLRRAVLFALTGVTPQDLQTPPAYLSLLGATAAGRVWLREHRETIPIPVIAKFADAAPLSPYAARQSLLTQTLDALFTLALPVPLPADTFLKISPRML